MKISFPSSLPPDYDNYSLFGNAWKDRLNGVTELSAQTGSGNANLAVDTERHAHQQKLLDARLNTFLDAASTPVMWTKTAIGGMEVPYLKAPLPAVRDMRALPSFSRARQASMKSFNESKAVSKVRSDYLRCDAQVRQAFLDKINGQIDATSDDAVRTKLEHLHAELSQLSEKNVKDLAVLRAREEQLDTRKADADQLQGKGRMLAQAKLFLKGTNGELRSVQRKTNEILNPSSYERHRAENNGEKVSNRPLHVEELKRRARGLSDSANPDLETDIGIRDFTEMKFDALADAMRSFRERVSSTNPVTAEDEQALRDAAKPILYSGDREAVHRFIRDMTRQLKRAGVKNADLEEVIALIPDKPSGAQKLVQSVTPGTGKQMRLQDEAERMAKALPKLLRLIDAHAIDLITNLMMFDLSGVKSLMAYVAASPDPTRAVSIDHELHSRVTSFISSRQGKAFIDAIVKEGIEHIGTAHQGITYLKKPHFRRDPDATLSYIVEMLVAIAHADKRSPVSSVIERLVTENQHLFMQTSDTEFWEREAVDKVSTRLGPDDDATSTIHKSRIFKQMKMRAAALGMDQDVINRFMVQGLANTLRNRNMAIEGTKIGGLMGSVAGNIASTPLSTIAAPYAPFLAIPGIMDLALMPAGWTIGLVPGAVVGATVLKGSKKDRLRETGNNRNAIPPYVSRDSDPLPRITYTSASKKLRPGGKRLVKREEVQKPTLTPMLRSGLSQFGHAHAQVWKGMGQEIFNLMWKPARYAFHTGPKDAWKDLVIHNDTKPKQATKTAYAPAFTSVAMKQTAVAPVERDASTRRASSARSASRNGQDETPANTERVATPPAGREESLRRASAAGSSLKSRQGSMRTEAEKPLPALPEAEASAQRAGSTSSLSRSEQEELNAIRAMYNDLTAALEHYEQS